jgi:chromosome segregation ATPase
MALDLEKEVRELKRRLDLAETRLAQLEGSFAFISGQLRDIQRFMHRKFDEIDAKLMDHDQRFDAIDARLDKLDANMTGLTRSLFDLTGQVEAIPRTIFEELDEREKRRSKRDPE